MSLNADIEDRNGQRSDNLPQLLLPLLGLQRLDWDDFLRSVDIEHRWLRLLWQAVILALVAGLGLFTMAGAGLNFLALVVGGNRPQGGLGGGNALNAEHMVCFDVMDGGLVPYAVATWCAAGRTDFGYEAAEWTALVNLGAALGVAALAGLCWTAIQERLLGFQTEKQANQELQAALDAVAGARLALEQRGNTAELRLAQETAEERLRVTMSARQLKCESASQFSHTKYTTATMRLLRLGGVVALLLAAGSTLFAQMAPNEFDCQPYGETSLMVSSVTPTVDSLSHSLQGTGHENKNHKRHNPFVPSRNHGSVQTVAEPAQNNFNSFNKISSGNDLQNSKNAIISRNRKNQKKNQIQTAANSIHTGNPGASHRGRDVLCRITRPPRHYAVVIGPACVFVTLILAMILEYWTRRKQKELREGMLRRCRAGIEGLGHPCHERGSGSGVDVLGFGGVDGGAGSAAPAGGAGVVMSYRSPILGDEDGF